MRRTQGLLESGHDRRALAADAGFGSLSIGSILAGVLVAYGAFATLSGIAAVVVDALNVDTDLAGSDYEQLGVVGGLIVAGVLLISYLFGGYVAGRMARRAGVLNGLAVAILGLAIAAAVAALVRASDAETINTSLRSLGVPTTADEYGQALSVAGIASLAAILIGSLLGGSLGERWHGKLLARAVDPNVGTEAGARRQAEAEMARAEQERTLAFDRARTANPSRSRRADRDALSADDRRVLDDDDDDDRVPAATTSAAAPTDPDDGIHTRGHNGGNGRVLTGRTAPVASAGGDNTVVSNRVVNTDHVNTDDVNTDHDASAAGNDDVAVAEADKHRRFRRRSHRSDR